MSGTSDAAPFGLPSQESVFAAPTYLVDISLGIATGFGIARITFGAVKLNPELGATAPALHPVVTIAVSEQSLLRFAKEVVERAEGMGITLDDQDDGK